MNMQRTIILIPAFFLLTCTVDKDVNHMDNNETIIYSDTHDSLIFFLSIRSIILNGEKPRPPVFTINEIDHYQNDYRIWLDTRFPNNENAVLERVFITVIVPSDFTVSDSKELIQLTRDTFIKRNYINKQIYFTIYQ